MADNNYGPAPRAYTKSQLCAAMGGITLPTLRCWVRLFLRKNPDCWFTYEDFLKWRTVPPRTSACLLAYFGEEVTAPLGGR